MECIFCKIVKGEIPSKKVYEDDTVLAIRDINPQAPVHILIIPKKHIENLAKTTKADTQILGKCQEAAKLVAGKEGIKEAFRLITLSGKGAGQSIFHLHYHLMGGWKGSKIPAVKI